MRRSHRAAHRAVWPLLTLGLGAALALALVLRPPPEIAPDAAAAGTSAEASNEPGKFTVLEVLE
ncbi:MAG: hypothetical protein ACK4NA_16430 [Alphaproteobacteria bacterium]